MSPFGYDPYGPPNTGRGRPAVILWFRIYAVTMPLLYTGFLLVWQFIAPADPQAPVSPLPPGLLAIMLLLVLFGAVFAATAMVPYKPWGWTVGLLAICIGMTGCLAPAAIALLVFWLKPETKAAFCRV